MKKALTIAGSDSGGGAGIQADLKTFAALGVYGTSVVTAVTAQNTREVRAIHELPPSVVAAQIDAVLEDIGADAVKTGMLASAAIIRTVAERLAAHQVKCLVVDPVMVATTGQRLLQADALDALRRDLLPLARVVTPNVPEAEVLVGHPLATDDDFRAAARAIQALGPRAVVLKGGHRRGDAIDLLYDGVRFAEFAAPRIPIDRTHGTGCTFASAIAAGLAKGLALADAVAAAKAYLTAALQAAIAVGTGSLPPHHFYQWWPAKS